VINQVTIQTGARSVFTKSSPHRSINPGCPAERNFQRESISQRHRCFQKENVFQFRKRLSAKHLLFLQTANVEACYWGFFVKKSGLFFM
jgi:hypothetical protein